MVLVWLAPSGHGSSGRHQQVMDWASATTLLPTYPKIRKSRLTRRPKNQDRSWSWVMLGHRRFAPKRPTNPLRALLLHRRA